MNLGKNIRKLTSEFLVGLRITKSPFDKLSDVKIVPNALSVSLNCTPNLQKTTLDYFKVYDNPNLNYIKGKSHVFNLFSEEKNFIILPTSIYPVVKSITEPETSKNITIETPTNINAIKNIDLPTNVVKEMFDPLGNIVKKEAGMSLVRIKRKKMRIHKYKKRHRKLKALYQKKEQQSMVKKESKFQVELQKILDTGKNFSAEKYVNESLEKLDWRPPIVKARGRFAPDWVVEEELRKGKINNSIVTRAKECAEKIKKKLS